MGWLTITIGAAGVAAGSFLHPVDKPVNSTTRAALTANRQQKNGRPSLVSVTLPLVSRRFDLLGTAVNGAKIRPVWDGFSPRRPRWASDFFAPFGTAVDRRVTERSTFSFM